MSRWRPVFPWLRLVDQTLFSRYLSSLRHHVHIRYGRDYDEQKQWCRRRVCKRTPKSFDLLKIRAKSLEILAKSLKIWAKMAPNVCRKIGEDHFFVVTPKNGWQKLHNFLGKNCTTFWAKILRTPKNLLAPTPMNRRQL